jgi:hypothetical protein
VVSHLPANAGDVGLVPGLGRYFGEGNGNPLPYSCLENSTDIMKKEKDMMLADEPPQVRRCPVCYRVRKEGNY